MKGIILCGGQSLRMGTDKGLLVSTENITWAQQTFSLLLKLDIEVVLSINEQQLASYKNVFTSQKLITDDAGLKIMGPLSGIASVHLQYPGEDLLVLACDMVEMKFEVLNFLNDKYHEQKNYEAYVFKEDNTPEPLCAIYTAKGLEKIIEKNKNNELKKYSLKYALEQMNVLYLPISAGWKKYFSNINSSADLQGT